MAHSLLYLGQDKQIEAALQAQSPCQLSELHWFAQRVCQHARAPDANRAALAALVPRIARQVGEHFLGQLTLALAHHLLGQAQLGVAAWQRATLQTLLAFSKFYAWAWGVCARNGIPSYQPVMWRDLPRFQTALRSAFSMSFNHVAYVHGRWKAIDGHGNEALRDALGWIVDLNRWDGLRLSLDFVRRHPVVVYRALRDGGA